MGVSVGLADTAYSYLWVTFGCHQGCQVRFDGALTVAEPFKFLRHRVEPLVFARLQNTGAGGARVIE
jgi:hypothetical protein